jgi:SAM-dependent methyltransferase
MRSYLLGKAMDCGTAPRNVLLGLCAALLAACMAAQPADGAPRAAGFPAPDRPVAAIVSSHSGEEAERDRQDEARQVMEFLRIGPGMTVADVGAGDGYFTVRLARRVGPSGRVIATDVVPEHLERLRARVTREGLSNVDFVLSRPDDPALPPGAVDVALLVRMYHEIEQPYAFMWRLREALKPDGVVAISERDRPTRNHGTPPRLLTCEIEAVGYKGRDLRDFGAIGYVAVFAAEGARPAPSEVSPCRG